MVLNLDEKQIGKLRALRNQECFQAMRDINPVRYERLTLAQKKELDDWYDAWLDVTETGVIPTKPSWLK